MSNVSAPSTAQLVAPIVGGAIVLALTATLSGCAAVVNTLQRVHEEEHPTYEVAAAEWVGVGIPSWIPSDATALRNYATNDESHAIVAVTTASAPIGCEPGARSTLPFAQPGWLPITAVEDENGTLLDSVLHCGDYEVVATADGWAGWFVAREPGHTPS